MQAEQELSASLKGFGGLKAVSDSHAIKPATARHKTLKISRFKRFVPVAIPLLAATVFGLDCLTPLGVVDWVLYFIPLILSFYGNGWVSPFPLAAVFSVLTTMGYYLSPAGMAPDLARINLFLGIGTLWVVAGMVAKLRLSSDEMRKLSRAVEQSPASVCITDLTGLISYVNPKFTEVTGYALEEVRGKNSRILKSGETPPEEYSRLWNTITASKEWTGTFHNRKKNGELYWTLTSIAPVLNDAGTPTHFLAVSEDITERKRVEEELVWKTAFLEAQVHSALDGILVVDSQGKKILQNQRLLDLFRIPKEIAEDTDDAKLLHYVAHQIKDPKTFLERVDYLYAHPDEIGRDEVELARGTVLDRYSSPVQDKAGNCYGRIWAFRDITDRRKLEQQFRQAQKMEGIGQLAGGVAHDFNNILAVIQMQSDLLRAGRELSAEQSGFAEEIRATVQRAAALTRQLLLFSRRETFQPGDLDLSQSIANTVKMLRRILGENVQMQVKLASEPMSIHADAGMMDQVLLNLVVNARDAMPDGGRVVIETSGVEFDEFAAAQTPQARAGSFICLTVSDSGCGIPPEALPRIFEPFFTTKEAGKGTGLGLATVFGIVQQHQGWVNVCSEVTRGTTFRIYLPRAADTCGQTSAKTALTALSGGNETILLVEDDPILRISVRRLLSQLGYRILEAPTGVKALELWGQNRGEIRLLLTDLMMPDGMTGTELAQRVLEENSRVKVIYMSGYCAEAIGKGFPFKEGDNFLTKPFQASKLVQTIRAMLDANGQP